MSTPAIVPTPWWIVAGDVHGMKPAGWLRRRRGSTPALPSAPRPGHRALGDRPGHHGVVATSRSHEPKLTASYPGVAAPGLTRVSSGQAHQRESARETRLRIMSATVTLFDRMQYDDVTIEAVARASGVSKSTIYRHWPSRQRLVLDAFAYKTDTMTAISPPVTPSETYEATWGSWRSASTSADPPRPSPGSSARRSRTRSSRPSSARGSSAIAARCSRRFFVAASSGGRFVATSTSRRRSMPCTEPCTIVCW